MGFGGAPPSFGIDLLNTQGYADFRMGRVTEDNLTEMMPESLLLANNILILADKMPTKRPGYTLVQNLGSGPVLATFDYQRDVDLTQFLISQVAGQLVQSKVDGTGAPLILSTGESTTKIYSFVVGSPFALYMANGVKMQGLFDSGGVNKLFAMGISAPLTAPTVALVAGTVTTTYGWQWAYCYVRKITDGSGVTRMHIGPPSPLSASSGPLTSQLANVSGFAAPPDPSWNFIWIFRTNDTPADSTDALFFDAEIPVATTTFADSNLDGVLDLTRPVPYENFPPPLGEILVMYQSRIAVGGLVGQTNIVVLGGFEEILLGLPAEAFPPALAFQVPGGKHKISGLAATNEAGFIGTKDLWFTITGYNAATLRKSDVVVRPGPIGKKACVVTPRHLVYLGRDRKLYGWDMASPEPINLSVNLGKPLLGSMSMEDISDDDVENAEVRWFSFGRNSFIMVLVNTGAVPLGQFDWIQMWNASFLGQTLPSDGVTIVGLIESDFWPSDVMSCSAMVEVKNRTYVFLGDPNGNIFRWPDGFLDNGKGFSAVLGSPWDALKVFIGQMFHPLLPAEVVKRLFWFDLHTNREDTQSSFQLEAIVADSPDMTLAPIGVPFGPLMASDGSGPVPAAARAQLHQVPRVSVGRWCRFFVIFPDDDAPAQITRFAVSAKPLYGIAP